MELLTTDNRFPFYKEMKVIYGTAAIDECIICKDEIILGITTSCNHSYHEECISEWLTIKNTCPYCRKIISSHDRFATV